MNRKICNAEISLWFIYCMFLLYAIWAMDFKTQPKSSSFQVHTLRASPSSMAEVHIPMPKINPRCLLPTKFSVRMDSILKIISFLNWIFLLKVIIILTVEFFLPKKSFKNYSWPQRMQIILNPFPGGRRLVSESDWPELKWHRWGVLTAMGILTARSLIFYLLTLFFEFCSHLIVFGS